MPVEEIKTMPIGSYGATIGRSGQPGRGERKFNEAAHRLAVP